MELQQILFLVRIAAVKAGESILEVYHSSEGIDVDYKADSSPLTLADQRSNKVINEMLADVLPGCLLISEENREIPFDKRKATTRAWMIDPLDGTKEFIKRNGEFTVNIALLEDGKPVLGVVYIPVLDELYWATRSQGAFMSKKGEEIRLRAKPFQMDQKGLRVVCSRSHLNQLTSDYIDALEKPELLQRGSSLKFLSVAKGEADLYPRLAPTMEWDTAAAQIIVEEAGGAVLRHPEGDAVMYNKENLLNPHFVVRGDLVSA